MPFGGSLYMNVVRFGFAGIDGHMAGRFHYRLGLADLRPNCSNADSALASRQLALPG